MPFEDPQQKTNNSHPLPANFNEEIAIVAKSESSALDDLEIESIVGGEMRLYGIGSAKGFFDFFNESIGGFVGKAV